MNSSSAMHARSLSVLNRLLALEHHSLPMYLTYARPWIHPGDEQATQTLADIVTDQRSIAERAARLVLERGGAIDAGEYPMQYTDTHDLSLDFLLKELVRFQSWLLNELTRLVDQSGADLEVRELVQEALGSERAHQEALEALLKRPAVAGTLRVP